MLAGTDDAAETAAATAKWFGNAEEFRSHARAVRRDEARKHNVKVIDLEKDDELQDAVLSVHHAAMMTLSRTGTVKLVESHRGRAWVNQIQQIQIGVGPGSPQQPLGLDQPAASGVRGANRAERRRKERG